MTRLGGSESITDRRVYAQSTEPIDTRDGIMWVDTSVSSRPVFVYSTDTGAWEPAAPDAVHRQAGQPSNPSDGDIWIDTDATDRPTYRYDKSTDTWIQLANQSDVSNNTSRLDSHDTTLSDHDSRITSNSNDISNHSSTNEAHWTEHASGTTTAGNTNEWLAINYYYDEVRLGNSNTALVSSPSNPAILMLTTESGTSNHVYKVLIP